MADNTDFTDVITMSSLGDKLREARERKNLTIGQANKQTHIHPAVLKALEDGNCENILNNTYVKSFLKQYSDYLGMDSGRVIREYVRLRPESGKDVAANPPEPKAAPKPSRDLAPGIKILATGIIITALILFAGIKMLSIFNRSAHSKPVSVSKNRREQSRSSSQKRAVPEKPKASRGASDVSISKDTPLKLLLKVNQNVFVKMRTDGNLLFERLLTKGTAEMFTADRSINIYVANGESVEFVLNGKSLGAPGKGLLKDVEITRSGVRLK